MNLDGCLPFDTAKFEKSLHTLKHRGPDAQLSRKIDEQVMLGHTRLSIIDLSDDSNQPMQLLDRYWVVYNGEIFNYLELREDLENLGASFRTSGDVEVLLQAYAHWGEDCVSRFNGMWAFAIYDTVEKTLFCSRDRFGEKPFTYAICNGRFFFASEIKAILAYEPQLKQPNYQVISNFCRSSVGAQHAETWFADIYRLPPGCNLTVRNGTIQINRYWHYPADTNREISFEAARSRYAELFRDAVRVRMRSDVPLGLTLSGGLDSISIAYTMQYLDPSPHFCFTAGFSENEQPPRNPDIFVDTSINADESEAAREVATELGLYSEVIETNYGDWVKRLSKIVYHLESCNSAPAVIPLMQLLEKASSKLRVVLEGQGADELLGGYVGSLLWQSIFDLLRAGKYREAGLALVKYTRSYKIKFSLILLARSASNKFPSLSRLHQKSKGINKVFGPRLRTYKHMPDYPDIANHGKAKGVGRELLRQHTGGLVNLLHYGDAISMANSVESRMPFLDHRLVDFVWRLPAEFKIKLGIGKYIHREAVRGLVPDRIVDNPIKYGFCTPISEEFRKSEADLNGCNPVEILLGDRCISRGLFDREGLEKLISAHQCGKHDHGPLLFRMLSTELWFRTFIDAQSTEAQA